MNNAALYKRSNRLQRRDARETVTEFGGMIKCRTDGQDSLLDIGCGDGGVTIEYILPLLPRNFDRLIGVDLSEQMILSARENHSHPNVSFETFDIVGDAKKLLERIEPVDHITSFYCLNWVQNQRKAVENIYNLLKMNGDCLLTMLANHPVFAAYKQMSCSEEWGEYLTDYKHFCTPYQNLENSDWTYRELLESCNFKEIHVEIREKFFEYDDAKEFENYLRSVNPFYSRIPNHKQDNYFGDLIKTMLMLVNSTLCYNHNLDKDFHIRIPYKLMIVYAKKRVDQKINNLL